MHARVNATEWNPEEGGRRDAPHRGDHHPELPGAAGLPGYILLTEPGGSAAMAITLWETEADMESSAKVAQAMIPKLKGILRAPPETKTYDVMFHVQP